jgi:organic hydroperoxide reductase OsmC/OhrA
VWSRGEALFTDNRYSRVHEWRFDGGATVIASAAPANVRGPYTSASAVDPEEAYVASLSSCHMLWFLYIAAKRGWTIDSYEDNAVGIMGKDGQGKVAVTTVTLRPVTKFAGPQPSLDELRAAHHEAHEECFLANSVKTEIAIDLTPS